MESTETPCRCEEAAAKIKECIRTHPGESAIASLGAGFLMAQLPLRLLLGVFMRLVLLVLKPAAILYGIYRLAEDCHARCHAQHDTEN